MHDAPPPYPFVVVGTDGSETATEAVCRAAVLAARLEARLLIATVYHRPDPEDLGPPSRRAELPADWMSLGYRAATDVAGDALKRAQQAAPGVQSDSATVEGDPADRLIALVEDRPGSLLVVGGQGMTSSARFVLGNVPNKITHHAGTDVLVVRTGSGSDGAMLPRRVLLAVDRSERAKGALRRGATLAAKVGAGVIILTVDPDAQAARATLDEAAGIVAELGVDQPSTMHREGDPAEEICSAAAEVDLVVLGNRGMTGAERFLLGSVPNKVSHHVDRDLLIVRTKS